VPYELSRGCKYTGRDSQRFCVCARASATVTSKGMACVTVRGPGARSWPAAADELLPLEWPARD
jgi:hypothetical protein